MRPDRLEARGLRRRFGDRVVVDALDLDLRTGEIVGLLGPNGAGKTTTFRMLAGLLAPHGGDVRLGETDVTRWPLWRRARAGLGYLPQEPSIFRRLTVAENVAVALRAAGRAVDPGPLLATFGLSDLAGAKGERLSGGERRRVELVRALAADPRLLLCDEPFSGLDPRASGQMAAHLRTLAAEGVGVLLTDHDVGQTLEVCDRLYIVAAGTVLLHGRPAEIAADARARSLYLGDRFPMPARHP
ncbi:LPS export ABC transporter ATP-binding protein [Myxococcota bacterium]|nr:LPS export ABC transporter ATP-binding protein [Myxococcota bacterium]